MMRVFYIVPSLDEASGWATASRGIVRSLRETGRVEPLLVVDREAGERARALLPGVELFTLPAVQAASFAHPRRWLRSVRALVAARLRGARGRRVDLVHSLEAYPSGYIGHLLAAATGSPHLVTAVGTYSVRWARANPLDRRLYLKALGGASCLCSISRATLERLREGLGRRFPEVPTRVTLLGTPTAEDDPPSTGVGDDATPILLSVGAIKRRKGQDLALRAFLRVRQRFPRAEFWLAGRVADPGYGEELRELLGEDGSGVRLLGLVPDDELERLYARASIFVLTPRDEGEKFEGFGLVYLEAGRFGLPVVGTAVGGVPEAVLDGRTGLLAEPEDVAGVAERIERLLTDPELARSLGRANRDRARELSWPRFARQQLEIYDSCLAGRPAAAPRTAD